MVHLPPGGALVPVTDTDVQSFDDQSVDEDCDATERVGVAPVDGVHAVEAGVDANKEGSGPAQFPGTSDSTSIMDDVTAADVKTALALDHMSSMNLHSESPMPSEPLVSQAQVRVDEASSPIAASRSFLDRQTALSADEQQQQMQQPIDDIFLFGRPQLLFGFVKIVMMILSLYVSLWITNYAFLAVPAWLKVRRKRHSIVIVLS